MRRIKKTAFLLSLLVFVLSATVSLAVREILSLEALREVTEPGIYYVIGKTGEPSNMHMKTTLTTNTTWQWFVKDQNEEYQPSKLRTDMTAYQAMSLSQRSLVLNHKDCELEVQVSSNGAWNILKVYGASESFSADRFFKYFFLAVLIFLLAGLIFGVILPRARKETEDPSWTGPSRRKPGMFWAALYVVGELLNWGNDRKK